MQRKNTNDITAGTSACVILKKLQEQYPDGGGYCDPTWFNRPAYELEKAHQACAEGKVVKSFSPLLQSTTYCDPAELNDTPQASCTPRK